MWYLNYRALSPNRLLFWIGFSLNALVITIGISIESWAMKRAPYKED